MSFQIDGYEPSHEGVLAARDRIRPYLSPTPLYRYPSLSDLVGADVLVKHENHQPVGAFKVRGGVNLVAQMPEEERRRGVMAASTGNHGQSVAYAARLFGVTARICVPEGANPVKVRSMKDLGAEVIFHGTNYDDARLQAEQLAGEHGYRYIHSGDEPHLIEGVGTIMLEVLDAEPDVDVVIVPVGGGSGAAGTCIVATSVAPHVEVIGVQSSAAPAAYRSWKEGRLVHADNRTIAEGLATGTPFALPQAVMRRDLDDFILVGDDAIVQAQRMMIEMTRNLVEAAGASSLAGALALEERVAGRRVVLICSGGNVTIEQLKVVLGWNDGSIRD